MKKIQYWASAFIIATSVLSTSCNKDDNSSIDSPENPITEEPSNPAPEPEKPAPVIIEQHFWQQESKEEVIVTETKKVELIEEVVETIKNIETPTSIVVSEDLSSISEEEVEEKLSEVATVLAQNPEQAKKTVLDLSETKLKKLTADTFKAQLGLSKAASDIKIYILKLILPESLEEIAEGACVDFMGTNFLISNINLQIEEGAFDPESGISFTLDPDLYKQAMELINTLKNYGLVKIAWENILTNGLTLTNNSASAQYAFPDTVKYSYLILNFIPNTDQVTIYKGYTQTNGKNQLKREASAKYHIQSSGNLSANILIDWGQGIDGQFFVSESDLYKQTFAGEFSGNFGSTFNTALWGSGVKISGSSNSYSPFVEIDNFDTARYHFVFNDNDFAKHDELGIKTSVSDEIKKIGSNGAFIQTPTHTITIMSQNAYIRESNSYDSIQVNYVIASDFSKITLSINGSVYGTIYGTLANNKVSYSFDPADYYHNYAACKDLQDKVNTLGGWIPVDGYYFRFLDKYVSVFDYSVRDSIFADYTAASDFSKVTMTFNQDKQLGTLTPQASGSQVNYVFAPSDYYLRYQAIAIPRSQAISDGQKIIRLLWDNYLSYQEIGSIDSTIMQYTMSDDYSTITAEDGGTISLSVKNQKVQYSIMFMDKAGQDLKDKIESYAWFQNDGYSFNFNQADDNKMWFTDKSTYDSIAVDYKVDAIFSKLTMSQNGKTIGTLVPTLSNGEVIYTFTPAK